MEDGEEGGFPWGPSPELWPKRRASGTASWSRSGLPEVSTIWEITEKERSCEELGQESEGVDITKNKNGPLHPDPPGAGRSGGANGPGLS